MAPSNSYSIYVRFRGRRLALLKHIRSLETARSALQGLRADRFHDADQVFLVDDATKQIVDEGDHGLTPGAQGGQTSSVEPHGDARIDEHTPPAARSGDGTARSIPGGKAHAGAGQLKTLDEPAHRGPQGDKPETRWSGVEVRDTPLSRLRRAMAAARAARARHDAALEAVARLHPRGVIDEHAQIRLESSARAASDLSAHALERLEILVKRIEGTS